MDYSIDERQQILQATVRRFFGEAGGPRVLEAASAEVGYDPALWRQFAAMGWLGLLAGDDEDSDGPNAVDAAVVAAEFGRAHVPAPFVDTAILAPHLLRRYGGPRAGDELAAIASGDRIWTIAHLGAAGFAGSPADDLNLQGGSLTGNRYFVNYAEQSQRAVVTATDDAGALTVSAAPFDSSVSFEALSTIDDRPQATVTFNRTPILPDVLALQGDEAGAAVAELRAWGAVMASAEMAGAAERVIEMTISYLNQRVQFGRPIGSFQATQHQAVDIAIDAQAIRVLMLQAAWYLSRDEFEHSSIAAAKGYASDGLRRVVETAHQLHGAIGFTMEHDLQYYYRRAKSLEVAYGDARVHKLAMTAARSAAVEAVA